MATLLSDYKTFVNAATGCYYEPNPVACIKCPPQAGPTMRGRTTIFQNIDTTNLVELDSFWCEAEKNFIELYTDGTICFEEKAKITSIINNTAFGSKTVKQSDYYQNENIIVPTDASTNKATFWTLLKLARKKLSANGGTFINLTPCWDILCLTNKLRKELIKENILYICIDTRNYKKSAQISSMSLDGSIIVPDLDLAISLAIHERAEPDDSINVANLKKMLENINSIFIADKVEQVTRIPSRLTPNDPRNGHTVPITKMDLEPLIVTIDAREKSEALNAAFPNYTHIIEDISLPISNDDKYCIEDVILDELWKNMEIYHRNIKALIATNPDYISTCLRFISKSNPMKKSLFLLIPKNLHSYAIDNENTIKTFKDDEDLINIIRDLN